MAAFYVSLAQMSVEHHESDHAILQVDGLQLVIHAIPPHALSPVSDHDVAAIRVDSYFKLCLPVSSIAAARAIAARSGGLIKSSENEWEARGFRACDGNDPEGNVIQVREAVAE